jgi:hypothetical protein
MKKNFALIYFILRNIHVINNENVKLTNNEFTESIKYKVRNLTDDDIYMASYMSPEMLFGSDFDYTTDIWYFNLISFKLNYLSYILVLFYINIGLLVA